ncbi:MAG: peptidase and DD-carboxypeptidase VanY/endolysin [Candidatus Paceibacter sp.]|jgi:D-alanyl-D-alanine carboxypeptidase|nr:peptidase and DD-carboxypeptidase VanY/endolysin [Candidatus Paceibacter sp.]
MKNIGISVIGVLIFITAGLAGYYIYELQAENKELQLSLEKTQATLSISEKKNADLVAALQEIANKNETFASQLQSATQNLNQLQWLNSLDTQLLQKYSKVYFLNENYTPKELSPIDTKFLFNKSRTLEIHDRVLPFLQTMLQAAAVDNVEISIASAYRSFEIQANLKSDYKVRYGSGANAFSADQGYSEHQLGTTLDFTTAQVGGGLTGFQKTEAYTWLKDNAHKYGFVLSYPPNNEYYIYEPWHWRFVGIELATKLHTDNKNFYDLDQREINTYLGNMFNTTLTP